MYREFKSLNLPNIDQELLQFWESQKIFEQSVNLRPADNSWVFYEGPPSANGKPGIHHVMARAIKDIFCRYQTLKGKRVERKGGWDTHGLPIELSVEKELGITKEDIGKSISVDEYNQKCRETVMRYKNEWDDITRKMGYWVDLDNPYITYENEYIETVWWIIKRLYDKGLLYKGYTIQPYSPGAGTGLSSHELNMPGAYKEVTDTTVVALFKVAPNPSSAFLFDDDNEDVRIAAWTTTPWTLPSNTALTIGHQISYVKIKTLNPYTQAPVSVVMAEPLVSKWFGGKNQPAILEQKDGITAKQLEGIRYEQLLPFGNEIEPMLGYDGQTHTDAFRVLVSDFVTTEDGTGVVHTAPSFGADDMKAARANGIGALTLVDKQGKFKEAVGEFSNRYVKNYTDDPDYVNVDVDIAVKLKLEGKALNVAKYAHNYPHCWRTDKPVLYYPLDSWFIKASAVKERMFELNKTINWKPASTGEGRFGKWLENLQDWNLSRSRYWGIGLPIWRTADGSVEKCIGSIVELQTEIAQANEKLGLSQTVPADLHRPYIDDIVLVADNGEPMKRELDLIDVWFDSGSMPYAQWGLDLAKLRAGAERPFNAPFDNMYPADFIAEGVDQTRGWFYTLHAIAVMAFDSVSFKNVVSNGLVLDKNGNKMSKRLGNAADPFETIAKYGADATRWYMISNAAPWDNLKFDPAGIEEVQRKFFGTLFNTYNFFATYANIDQWKMDEFNVMDYSKRSELDRWVISKLYSLVADYHAAMDDYEPHRACRLVESFVDEHLSNWYVRLSRRRFWRGEMSEDKNAAYQTLFECLMVVGQLASPIAPFFTDWLYRNLTAPIKDIAKQKNTPLRHDSVHLTDLGKPEPDKIDLALEKRMDYAQRICSLAFSVRKLNGLRVRLPLQKILLPVLDERFITEVDGVKDLILSEINVKEIEYITDASGLLKKQAKANFKTLGAKLGKDMKAAAEQVALFTNEQINALEKAGKMPIEANGTSYELTPEDLVVTTEDLPGWKVASDGPLTVALDVTLTPELEAEGIARDLVNRIQNLRKDKELAVTDRITIRIEQEDIIDKALESFRDYIKSEVLASDLIATPLLEHRSSDFTSSDELKEDLKNSGTGNVEKIEITDDLSLGVKIEKIEDVSEKMTFIRKLINAQESDRVERTTATKNIDKFSEAICAFSNDFPRHNQAGYLLIGVNDDGTLSGLKVTDELLKDLASIRNNGQILPQPAVVIDKYSFPEGDVAVVQVLPSLHPPVRYKGRVWIRVGAAKAVANETEERRLMEKRTAVSRSFDDRACAGAKISDVSVDSFRYKYLPSAVDPKIIQDNHRDAKEQLTSLRMYDILHDCPTNAGLLLLGTNPLFYYPGAYIQYVKFDGKSMTDKVLGEKRFSGALVDMLPTLEDFIKVNIGTEKPVKTGGFVELQSKAYPFWALRELFMNAIIHRDYESNAPIFVYEFSDRIEIKNPGGLFGDAKKENFPRVSDYRNPTIAEALKNLGYVNRFNIGIANAQKVLKENGNPEAIFDLSLDSQFLVTIFQLQEA